MGRYTGDTDQFLPTYLQAPSQATLDSLPLTLAQLKAISNNPVLGPLGFGSKITWWRQLGTQTTTDWRCK